MPSSDIRDEIIAFTQELVRINSLPGKEEGVARAVEKKMRALDFDEVWMDAFGNVVARRDGAGKARILFDSHTDVVEVTSRDAWTCDPFGGEMHDGKIWGRGATDMKGALAAAVVALGRIPREELSGTIFVSASVGEEQIEGAALEKVMPRVNPDVVVICEPSECCLGIGQKGRAGIWIDVRGKPAHTSDPRLGDNAVYKALTVVERLRAMPLPKDELLGDALMELVEIISRPFPGVSIVPDGCALRFDRRLVRGETMATVLDSLRGALADLPDWDAGFHAAPLTTFTNELLNMPDFHPAWATDKNSRWVRNAARGLQSAQIAPGFFIAPYCTNGSYSAGVAGVPTIIFGPSTIKLAHAIDEYIETGELLRGAEGFVGLARELGK